MERDPHDAAPALDGTEGERAIALATMLRDLPDAVLAIDADAQITFVNAEAERLFGYGPGQLAGEPIQLLWPERFHGRYLRKVRRRFATGGPRRSRTESWGCRRDGSEFLAELSWRLVLTDGGPRLIAIGRDVTSRAVTEAGLRALVTLAERALAGADAQVLAGETVELMLGSLPVSGAEVTRAGGEELARAGWVDGVRRPMVEIPLSAGAMLRLATERPLADQELSIVRGLAATLSMALERLRDDERVRYDAMHDPLTGVANRVLLADRLRHALDGARRSAGRAAVLFIDLDRFKRVNDEYGHAVGDAVLIELARRVSGSVRPGDTVARYGGDEFAAICEDLDESTARIVAERILDAVNRPVATTAGELRVSASVGVAVGGSGVEELLAHADIAAYRAKAGGRSRVELYAEA